MEWRINTMAAYGLNNCRNFLASGENELCDMSVFDDLLFEVCDDDELYATMNAFLVESGYQNCAIFAHKCDGEVFAMALHDEITELLNPLNSDDNFFARVDGELLPDVYALIIEVTPGMWRIVDR